MKVPGSDGSNNALPKVKEGLLDSAAVQRRKSEEASAQPSGLLGELSKSSSDRITVSPLSAKIRAELNPANMIDERRAKIDQLRQQVANGTYAPPPESVAKSISEEISLEVLLSGNGK
jgi:flagellar biosynthesis anti-sigma factor FlgM